VILCAIAIGIRNSVWIPWTCERRKAALERATLAAVTSASAYRAKAQANRNLEEIERCRRKLPTDLDYLMLAAANLRTIGRSFEAIEIYRSALATARRPELYWNLGEAYAESGNEEQAFRWMLQAAYFAPAYLDEMDSQGGLRSRLLEGVRQRESLIRAGKWRQDY
jgi:tetratricopeptide (TPR) repeat protein